MKKPSRRLLLIVAACVLVLAVLAGGILFFNSRPVTSYGSAEDAKDYAPAVAKMVASQQEIADSMQAFFEQDSKDYGGVQQNFDHQSAQASSQLEQWLSSSNCEIGQVRYTDVLNLSVTVEGSQAPDINQLLEQAGTDGVLATGKIQGTSVFFSNPNFRVDVTSVSTGDRYTLRLTVPNLPDAADRAAYACYPTNQVPLSSVQQLG